MCVEAMLPNAAHAYFDPGTGSMLLQALAAGLIGVAAFWRHIKEKISSVFSSKKIKNNEFSSGIFSGQVWVCLLH
ncbi:MAG: hypothetical protein E7022_12060 [Desulfovibrio desulfuricans]|nr:hypothetical protein [Desulfovibrio desulfuricans]